MTFTDSKQRNWTLTIDYPAILRLRNSDLQIDLLQMVEHESDPRNSVINRLASDDMLLIDVICELLEPEITRRGIDAADFAAGMCGNGLENALDALIEGVANFSRPRKGELIRKMWSKSKSLESSATTRAVSILDSNQLDDLMHAKLDTLLQPPTSSP